MRRRESEGEKEREAVREWKRKGKPNLVNIKRVECVCVRERKKTCVCGGGESRGKRNEKENPTR